MFRYFASLLQSRTVQKSCRAAIATIVLMAAMSFAQTKQIDIGKFTYVGTFTQQDGTTVALYDVLFATPNVTMDPLLFGNVTVIVKGSQQDTKHGGFPTVSTWYGCTEGSGLNFACDLLFTGGADFDKALATCATFNATKNLFTQNCISIALGLTSLTGKNFSFTLANGETFCTSGITNIFLEAENDETALDPRCVVDGCYGIAVPIKLHALPAKQCSQ